MSVPLPPTDLPGLAPLLSGELWSRWAREGRVFPVLDLPAAVRYVRLKPRTSCRLAVLVEDSAAPGGVRGYRLHLYPDGARASAAFAKLTHREAFLDAGAATVVSPFPHDPELPGLRHFHRDYRLKQALLAHLRRAGAPAGRVVKHRTTRRLLAYKPGRRAVYRVDVCLERGADRRVLPVYARVEARPGFAATAARLEAIHAAVHANGAFEVGSPLTPIEDRGWLIRAWQPGRTLAEAPRGAAAAFEAAGRALGALHRCKASLPSRAPSWPAVLRRQAEGLAELLPEESTRLVELARRLATTIDAVSRGPDVFLHGDFHPGQVILGAAGPSLVDFDRAAYGDAAADLGSMLAYLAEDRRAEAEREAFLAGYRETSAAWPPAERLALTTAAAGFGRLVAPFRRLAPDWPERIRRGLDRIESTLAAVVS